MDGNSLMLHCSLISKGLEAVEHLLEFLQLELLPLLELMIKKFSLPKFTFSLRQFRV